MRRIKKEDACAQKDVPVHLMFITIIHDNTSHIAIRARLMSIDTNAHTTPPPSKRAIFADDAQPGVVFIRLLRDMICRCKNQTAPPPPFRYFIRPHYTPARC